MNEDATAADVVTGKPLTLGGSLGRREATGRGVFTVGCEAAKRMGLPIAGARIAVQGFGNVDGITALLFVKAGGRLVAFQEHAASLYNGAGIDASASWDHVQLQGSIMSYADAETVAADAFWDTPCDVMIPAAMEQEITPANAQRIQARLVIEGAKSPTTPEADDILRERNILVVPDVIANAGGVTAAFIVVCERILQARALRGLSP